MKAAVILSLLSCTLRINGQLGVPLKAAKNLTILALIPFSGNAFIKRAFKIFNFSSFKETIQEMESFAELAWR